MRFELRRVNFWLLGLMVIFDQCKCVSYGRVCKRKGDVSEILKRGLIADRSTAERVVMIVVCVDVCQLNVRNKCVCYCCADFFVVDFVLNVRLV